MKRTLCIIALLMMSACTMNQRETHINFTAGTSLKVEANGATNATETGQTANGDFSGLVDAVSKWVEENMAGIVGKLKVTDLVDESKLVEPEALDDKPAAVSPAGQGEFEEIE